MILVTFEKHDIRGVAYTNISKLCNTVDGMPELKEGKSVVVEHGIHRFEELRLSNSDMEEEGNGTRCYT